MRAVFISLLFLVVVGGCYADPYFPVPPVPPPVPPQPIPPDPTPTPPEPTVTVPRTTFDDLNAGDDAAVLGGIPSPERIVQTDGGKAIHVWVLDEQRPGGGQIRWEVHVVDGKIVASFPW